MTIISTAPVQVTPPAVQPITLAQAKAHLRVDHADEDDLIDGLVAGAVAYLDGWGGVLGRAIMPQQWRQEFCGWGTLRLALPDVTGFTLTAEDDAGAPVMATSAALQKTGAGWAVVCDGPSVAKVVVTYDVALPAPRLPAARAIVKLLIGHWYDNRGEGGGADIPPAARSLIAALRWMPG